MTEYLQALLASVTIRVIIPLLILALIALFVWWLLHKASQHKHFHIEEVLLDHDAKVSATRLIALLAFGVSSWHLAVQVINLQSSDTAFLYYLLAWSGSLVLKEGVSKWDGKLPFAKGVEA